MGFLVSVLFSCFGIIYLLQPNSLSFSRHLFIKAWQFVTVCVRGPGSILMGLEWQGCSYLSGGQTEAGNGEEYSPMGGNSGWMGTEQRKVRGWLLS